MHHPLSVGFFGDAQLAAIQSFQRSQYGFVYVFMSGARGDIGTGVPCLFYGALQVCGHRRSTCWIGSKRVADVRGRLAAGHEKELAGALWLHASAHKIGDSFGGFRSEEHTSELQSLMRISYAVFCLKKKKHYE